MTVDRVRQAFETYFEAHKGDCSGFAHAVATKLEGHANEIVDALSIGQGWTRVYPMV
jgi:hypothetical protein